MLPHFTNLVSTDVTKEPIYSNLFEIVVTLPALVAGNNSQQPTVLLENATNINLSNLTKKIDAEDQRFKYSNRAYLKTPSDTHISSLNINFNINQNDQKAIETWVLLKKWYDLLWNSQTGELHYKRDSIGQITVNVHDRTGEVIRRVDFVNVQCNAIGSMDFNWEGGEGIIAQTQVGFFGDYWIDSYFDF